MPRAVPETVSACIIARDEEERLPACLASVAFCDEIVVVDGGSTDRTIDVARARGARVVEQAWLGFAAQRNVALDHATGDWVLEIDADERVSPALRTEIEAFLASPPAGIDMAALPRRHRFLGGWLGPAGRYPDYRHRLFRRGAYRHDERRTVHEGLWPRGPVHPFTGDLEHLLAGSLGEALRDIWSYARAESEQLAPRAGAAPYATGMLVRPPAKLAYRLIVGGGWRDGWRGALRLTLESASDAVVWGRALRQRAASEGGAPAGSAGAPTSGDDASAGDHFGGAGAGDRGGPPRFVAVARGPSSAERAAAWLERAAHEVRADAVLVTDSPVPGSAIRARALPSAAPLGLARALEAEHQLRPIDAVLVAGRAERRRLRLVPAASRGIGVLTLDADPAAVTAEVETALRPSGSGI
jgi:Glycosyl transferase family 2